MLELLKSKLPYDLLEVKINKEVLHARPVEWSGQDEDGFGRDKDGEYVHATKWHTTCPGCAQLIEFSMENCAMEDESVFVSCETCNIGRDKVVDLVNTTPPTELQAELQQILEDNTQDTQEEVYQNTCDVFQNPVIAGTFEV